MYNASHREMCFQFLKCKSKILQKNDYYDQEARLKIPVSAQGSCNFSNYFYHRVLSSGILTLQNKTREVSI